MTAPVLAEGRCDFEERAGGELVVVTFDNGASLVMSRHTMFAAGRAMANKACEAITSQSAEVIRLNARR